MQRSFGRDRNDRRCLVCQTTRRVPPPPPATRGPAGAGNPRLEQDEPHFVGRRDRGERGRGSRTARRRGDWRRDCERARRSSGGRRAPARHASDRRTARARPLPRKHRPSSPQRGPTCDERSRRFALASLSGLQRAVSSQPMGGETNSLSSLAGAGLLRHRDLVADKQLFFEFTPSLKMWSGASDGSRARARRGSGKTHCDSGVRIASRDDSGCREWGERAHPQGGPRSARTGHQYISDVYNASPSFRCGSPACSPGARVVSVGAACAWRPR